MKSIKVQFTWTELIRITNNRSTFQKIQLEINDYTFEEIKEIHKRNFKGVASPHYQHGYLTDKWHDSSVRFHLEKLRQEVEKEDTVFQVELDYPWLRFAPMIIKTKKETV